MEGLRTKRRIHVVGAISAAAALLAACGGGDEGMHVDRAPSAALAAVNGVATFTGNRTNYTVAKTSAGFIVKDNVGAGGTQTVTAATSLVFADYTVNVGIGDLSSTIAAADLKTLVELYIAFFNRVPDADGLSYWIAQFKGGSSIDSIADSFYDAAVHFSSVTGYTSTMTNSDFVRIIYRNVLGRSGATAPPDEDIAFWAGKLDSGAATRGSLIRFMLTSAHSFKGDATWGWVADLLDNKYSVGVYFAVQQGLNFNSSTDNVTKGAAIAAAVTSTGTSAATSLIGVGDTAFTTLTSAPGAPTIGTATSGDGKATVAFTAPASDGGAAILDYTAACTGGGLTKTSTGASSPIAVQGLTNGTAYTCTVSARNLIGTGAASAGVGVTPAGTTGSALLTLAANSTISLDTCGGTIGAGVPDFFRNYFMCSNRSLSADGQSVVIKTYGLPPYSSPYYPATHPNYVAYSVDRAGQVCGTGVPLGTNGCHVKNPNTLAQQSFTLTIPLAPVAKGINVNGSASQIDNTSGDPLDYSGAVMGVAANGVPLFSAFAAPGDDINQEAYTFDSHEGHPQNSGVYHYHQYSPGPLEVMRKKGYGTSVTPGSPNGGIEFYGITCDGVLIFGVTELDGTTPTGTLDAQGGHVHDIKDKSGTLHFSGRYHVHLSPSAIGSNSKAYKFVPELQYYSTCNSTQ